MTGRAGRWFRGHLPALVAFTVLPVLPVLPVFPVFPLISPLSAQSIRAEGSVVKADSAPVSGIRVVLHQVGRTVQGPLDSMRTDRNGRFRFSFRPDTSALYLLSARYDGIEYFSPPVHTNPERPDTGLKILVYDTSSTAPIALEARHIVLTRPGEDGSRSVLDLIVLRNDGRRTRITSDSLHPSWSGPLPQGTVGLELGESDFSPDAVSRQADSLIVTAPLAPGEKQLTVQYLVPSSREVVDLPFTHPGTVVNVLTEEKGVTVSGGSLALADSQIIQGRSFRRWTGTIVGPGSIRVTLPGTRRTPKALLGALVLSLALVLVGASWYLLRRRPAGAVEDQSDELLDAIAALDSRYLGREADTPADEWSSYQTDRGRLKARLEASLAARGPGQ